MPLMINSNESNSSSLRFGKIYQINSDVVNAVNADVVNADGRTDGEHNRSQRSSERTWHFRMRQRQVQGFEGFFFLSKQSKVSQLWREEYTLESSVMDGGIHNFFSWSFSSWAFSSCFFLFRLKYKHKLFFAFVQVCLKKIKKVLNLS